MQCGFEPYRCPGSFGMSRVQERIGLPASVELMDESKAREAKERDYVWFSMLKLSRDIVGVEFFMT